jgi:MFS family permease
MAVVRDEEASAVASRARSLLRRNRDFRLLWFGESVSGMGTAITYLALPFVALNRLHASTFQVAALSALETMAWPLLGLPAGVWVDRWSRRRVLIMTDVGRALALSSIPVAAGFGVLGLPQLFAVAAVTGVLTLFFAVAYPTYLPTVVEKNDLVEGNSLLSGTESFAQVSGPAIAGALVQAIGAAYAVVADVVSYVVSAVSLTAIRSPEPPAVAQRRAMRHEVAEGVRFLAHHRVLRAFIAAAAISNFFAGGAQAIAVVFLVNTVHVRAGVVGLLFAIGAGGGIVGAVVAARLVRRIGDARAMVLAAVVEATSAYLVPATTRGWGLIFFCAGTAIAGFSIIVFNVVGGSYRQEIIPARLMGRAVAANRMVTWGVLPLGSLTAGWLATSIGVRSALWVLAIGLALAPISLAAAGLASLRELPRTT